MKSIFFLDSMLTPKLITFIYWISILAAIIAGGGMIANGTEMQAGMGVAVLFGVPILVRLWCELWVVIFKIHENLKKIADKT